MMIIQAWNRYIAYYLDDTIVYSNLYFKLWIWVKVNYHAEHPIMMIWIGQIAKRTSHFTLFTLFMNIFFLYQEMTKSFHYIYWYSFGLLLVTWSKSLALRDLKSLARIKKAKKYEKSWSLDFISTDYFVIFSTFVLLLQNRWMTVAAFWRRRSKLREMKSSSSSSANRYWSSRSFSKNSTWKGVR